MKLLSWNINSVKAALTAKSNRAKQTRLVLDKIIKINPDVIAFQETKIPEEGLNAALLRKIKLLFPNYSLIFRNSTPPAKTSYSGVMFLIKNTLHPKILKPNLKINSILNHQGRIITLEFAQYYLVQAYIPHYQWHQLDLHSEWMAALKAYLYQLMSQKPIIVCGDLAIIPLKSKYQRQAEKELTIFHNLLGSKLLDTYAMFNSKNESATWWPATSKKLPSDGLRMDFWLISGSLKEKVISSKILPTGQRCDHAPILLTINLNN